jgi:hypothetical protein
VFFRFATIFGQRTYELAGASASQDEAASLVESGATLREVQP